MQLNQSLVIDRRCHLAISGRVLVRNWFSVLAVTTTLQSSQVSMPHFTSIEIRADLPMPWPEARQISSG